MHISKIKIVVSAIFFHLTKILLDENLSIEQRLEQATKYEEENDVDFLVGITVSVMFAGGKWKSQQEQEEVKMIPIFEHAREEGLREGIQKGIQKGIEKGIQKGKSEGEARLIFSMYRNGLSVQQIANFTSKDVEEIRNVIVKRETVRV